MGRCQQGHKCRGHCSRAAVLSHKTTCTLITWWAIRCKCVMAQNSPQVLPLLEKFPTCTVWGNNFPKNHCLRNAIFGGFTKGQTHSVHKASLIRSKETTIPIGKIAQLSSRLVGNWFSSEMLCFDSDFKDLFWNRKHDVEVTKWALSVSLIVVELSSLHFPCCVSAV